MEIKRAGGWRQDANVDTYTLQRAICAADSLSPTARHVGMALALAMDATTGHMRVRLDTLADQCGGYSKSTLLRGLNSLIRAGLVERQRTGRSAIYTVPAGIESGRVEVSPATHQKCHPRHFDRPSEIFGNAEEGDKAWRMEVASVQNEKEATGDRGLPACGC